ncbi:MAG: leucyl/phenylalanyl-tRNA--protein transferase, partial [Bacteroidota bacterium]
VKLPRSLKQSIKKYNFRFTVNNAFEEVISACADREETWISDEIIENYLKLHHMGHAHSVETYIDDELAGGLYGVSLGGAFFGESMFNNISDASKAAFYHLVKRLKLKGFILLDSQYINEHTKMLGAIEVPRDFYLKQLTRALTLPVDFD